MTEKQLREYYEFFTGLWRLFKEFNTIKQDADWEKAIDAFDKLCEGRNFKTKMAATMAVAVMDEIERLNKDGP